MRIVIAPVKPEDEPLLRLPPPGRSDEIICFGPGPANYAEQVERLPAGWRPDAYLLWSIEYNSIPVGLEEADCLTVGVVGDWNLGGQAFQLMGGLFDLLIADRNGCARLREAGFENVCYAPLWAFDPLLHRRMPEVQRDLDIVMVGNFNHDVQRERARWLARVAKLSRKYRVCVTGNVYGEDYVRLMNRAKIVFNRSIRGEINMRAYEAPACGALMFYERENAEIRDLFADRQECVLYGYDDLEDLLDHYLTHEDERERIANAGHRKVQEHTWAHVRARVFALIEDHLRSSADLQSRIGARPFCSLPPAERRFRHAYHGLLLPDRQALKAAESMLLRAQDLLPDNPCVANARACLLAEWAGGLQDQAERQRCLLGAREYAARACHMQPDYVVAWINLAYIHLALGDLNQAEAELGEAVSLLDDEDLRAEQLRGPYYPRRFDAFSVELERVWGTTIPFLDSGFSVLDCPHPGSKSENPESPVWVEAMRSLLLWRAWETLSDLAFARGRNADAVDFAAEAVARRPDIGTTRYRLARALRAVGRSQEAEAEYRRALEDAPFCHEMWFERAELLRDLRQYDQCQAFLEEIFALLDGCPFYDWLRAHLETLWASLASERARAPLDGRLRLLALPDWNDPQTWQPLLRRYAQVFSTGDPVTLTLGLDARQHPPMECVVAALERFLVGALQVSVERIPDVMLAVLPSRAEERRRLFQQADAFVAVGDPADAALAQAAGIPILSVESLDLARGVAAAQKAA